MTDKNLYVSEPGMIDTDRLKQLLPENFRITAGDTTFSGSQDATHQVLVIRSGTHVGSSIKQSFPNLEAVIRVGTGLDNVDLDFCKAEGIAVYNAAGANSDAVSDYIVCMMLVALRKFNQLTEADVTGWNRTKFTGHSMSARTVGIVGFGHIGRLVHQKLAGFGCQGFVVFDPYLNSELPDGVQRVDDLDKLLRSCDLVTLHVPLLPETKYLINKDNLPLLKDGSILLNASRGGVVSEADVLAYAQDHDITYIADTVEGEPRASEALRADPHVIVTPHIASLTKESEDAMLETAVKSYLAQAA
jgi:phosphoglycerate dehydrogenase-like enzyme